jgi:hypothetical protein
VRPRAVASYRLEEAPDITRFDCAIVPPQGRTPIEYRFFDDGEWLPFVLPLELSAVQGEERSYILETRTEASASVDKRSIVIDKRPPLPPAILPKSGLYTSPQRILLSAEPGSEIRYALFESGKAGGAFLPYSPAAGIDLSLPHEGSATFVVLAYARDGAGNESAVSRGEYRLASGGAQYAPPSIPPAIAESLDPLADLPDPVVRSTRGGVSLAFALPAEGELYVSVNPAQKPQGLSDFVPLASDRQSSELDFRCPPAWSGREAVYVGLLAKGSFRFREAPLVFTLADDGGLPPAPEPILVRGAAGSVVIAFPPFDGRVFYAVSGGPAQAYEAPVVIPATGTSLELSWYAVDGGGRRSKPFHRSLALPAAVPGTALIGIASGAVVGQAVALKPSGPGVVRYELSKDGTMPVEPGPDSPLVGEALVLDAPPGEEVRYAVRYRSFSGNGGDAMADEGGALSFTVDKKAPPPPLAQATPPAYASEATSIALVSPGSSAIYASVETDGASSGYLPLSGPIVLPGSISGAVSYRVHAYAVDAAGNRSADMEPVAVSVDRANLYVSAPPLGSSDIRRDGSRDRPFANLDDALDAALAKGSQRSAIRLRGRVALSKGVSIDSRSLTIVGGYGDAWQPDPSLKASVEAGGSADVLFFLSNADLSLKSLDIAVTPSQKAFISARGGAVSLEAVNLLVSAHGDFQAFNLDSSRLHFKDCSLAVEKAGAASLVKCRNSDVTASSSSFSAGAGVSYFGAIALTGGSLDIQDSRFASAASLGSRIVSTEGASVAVERSFFKASGGPGFLAVGDFRGGQLRFANSIVDVDWQGSASLFHITGQALFLHDTLRGKSAGANMTFFSADGAAPIVRDSIAVCDADKSCFLAAALAPLPGDLASIAFSGFSAIVSGRFSLATVLALGRYNGSAALPCLEVDSGDIFAAEPGQDMESFALAPSTRCRDSGSAEPDAGKDALGRDWPAAGGVDLGALRLAP